MGMHIEKHDARAGLYDIADEELLTRVKDQLHDGIAPDLLDLLLESVFEVCGVKHRRARSRNRVDCRRPKVCA